MSEFYKVRKRLNLIVEGSWFTGIIITLILINAIIVGLETFPTIYSDYKQYFMIADRVLLYIFTIELVMRFLAVKPKQFFTRGWNWFDLLIVGAGHIFVGGHF